jgi:hypothetical protein
MLPLADDFDFKTPSTTQPSASPSAAQLLTNIRFHIAPKKLLTYLLLMSITLVTISYIGDILIYRYELQEGGFAGTVLSLLQRLNVDQEISIPTWYSVCLLFSAFFLLYSIATHPQLLRHRRLWSALTVIFLCLSIIEGIALNDGIGAVLRFVVDVDTDSAFRYRWVIVAIPAVLIIGALYVPFIRALPSRIRLLVILGAALYVGGAIGAEMINAYMLGRADILAVRLVVHIEELCEMIGMSVFIYTLLNYLLLLNQPADLQAIAQ